MTDTRNLTNKQYRIMAVLCSGNGKDENGNIIPCDIDELIDRLTYDTTKNSMQFSIRALERRNLITRDYEHRRGRNRVVLHVTIKGKQLMGYGMPSVVQDSDLEFLTK